MELKSAFSGAEKNNKDGFREPKRHGSKAVFGHGGPLLVLGSGQRKDYGPYTEDRNLIKYGRALNSDEIPGYIDEESFPGRYAASPGNAEKAAEKLCTGSFLLVHNSDPLRTGGQ